MQRATSAASLARGAGGVSSPAASVRDLSLNDQSRPDEASYATKSRCPARRTLVPPPEAPAQAEAARAQKHDRERREEVHALQLERPSARLRQGHDLRR